MGRVEGDENLDENSQRVRVDRLSQCNREIDLNEKHEWGSGHPRCNESWCLLRVYIAHCPSEIFRGVLAFGHGPKARMFSDIPINGNRYTLVGSRCRLTFLHRRSESILRINRGRDRMKVWMKHPVWPSTSMSHGQRVAVSGVGLWKHPWKHKSYSRTITEWRQTYQDYPDYSTTYSKNRFEGRKRYNSNSWCHT